MDDPVPTIGAGLAVNGNAGRHGHRTVPTSEVGGAMVPAAAEVTALPPAVTVSVVDVVVLVAAAAAFPARASARPRQGRASLRNWLLGIHEKRQREGEDGKDLNAFVTAEGLHSRKECASRF